MSEERYIHIRNWDRFQHYKKRGAPWIKDYTEQLRDEDWLALSFRQRGLLQGLRLLYAARGWQGIGCSPARLGTMLGDPSVRMRDLEALNHAGFILFDASKMLERQLQDATPEVEVDLEVEEEQEDPSFQSVSSNGDRKEGEFELEDEIIVVVDDGIDEDYRF